MPTETIFLSHSSKDNPQLEILIQQLRCIGVPILVDQQIPPGGGISRWMSESLEKADRLLLAWSRSAKASPHVWNELDAFYMRKPDPGYILFLKLDETAIPTLYTSRRYLTWTGKPE